MPDEDLFLGAALTTGATAAIAFVSYKYEQYCALQKGLALTHPVLFLASNHLRETAQYETVAALAPVLKERGYDVFINEGKLGSIGEPATLTNKMDQMKEVQRKYATLLAKYPDLKKLLDQKDTLDEKGFNSKLSALLQAKGYYGKSLLEKKNNLTLSDGWGDAALFMFSALKEQNFGYKTIDEDGLRDHLFLVPESKASDVQIAKTGDELMLQYVRDSIKNGHTPIASFGAAHLDCKTRHDVLKLGAGIDGTLQKEGVPCASIYLYDSSTTTTDATDTLYRSGTSGIHAIDTYQREPEDIMAEIDSVCATAMEECKETRKKLAEEGFGSFMLSSILGKRTTQTHTATTSGRA